MGTTITGFAKWTEELHTIFCKLCAVKVINDKKVRITLNNKRWIKIHIEFKRQKKDVSESFRRFKNHYDAMKVYY